jgi:hypothetical protein
MVSERVSDRYASAWRWREVRPGWKNDGVEKGESDPRDMRKLKMAGGQYSPPYACESRPDILKEVPADNAIFFYSERLLL